VVDVGDAEVSMASFTAIDDGGKELKK